MILSGTFAAMMAGEVAGLKELGFAVAVGVLIDTFVVRTVQPAIAELDLEVEEAAASLGAGRLLFGSGFPDAEPMGTAMQLLYADIPEADKQQIGSGTIRRLMGEIVR